MNKKTAYRMASLLLAVLTSSIVSLFGRTALAQDSDSQATIDAFVSGAFTQTAQAESQPNMTQTLAAAFNAAQTATKAAQATPTPTPTATPEPFNADALEVVSVTELDFIAGPGRSSAYLSPDGTRFAYIGGDGLCIHTIDGSQQVCSQVSTEDEERLITRLDNESIYWSPDGRHLVMTVPSLIYMIDSDIWIMNVDTGELTNLTDDFFDKNLLFGSQADNAPEFWLDVAPRWSSDSTRVAFIRYTALGGSATPSAYAVNIKTRITEELGRLSVLGGIPSYALAWSHDGTTLAYNIWDREGGGATSGAWLFTIAGKRFSQAAGTEPEQSPIALDFSPDGRYLWMYNDVAMGAYSARYDPEISPSRIVSLEDHSVTLVDAGRFVTGAGWSPTGSALAYIVRNTLDEENSGLYLTSEPGKPGRLVLQGLYSVPTSRLRQPIVWASDNTILLSRSPEPGLVVVKLG